MPDTKAGSEAAFDVPADVFSDHVILRPPNRLKERLSRRVLPNAAPETDVVRRAENALDLLSSHFDDWMAKEVLELERAREAAALSREITTVSGVYRVAHDIRGQAATLGYPLVGEIAEGLCGLFERMEDRQPPQDVLDRHVEAIRAMVRENVRDRDHPIGIALAKRLHELREAAGQLVGGP